MFRSDDLMLTAEELRQKRTRRRRWIVGLAAAILLATLAALLARPVRNEVKGWQARRHAQKAFALIEEQNWNEARAEAVAAYQLRQSEPEALRAVARFLSRTRQQQALEFWDQLAKRERLTRDDRRDEATVALVSGETQRSAAAVEALVDLEAKDTAPRDWLLAAQVWLQQGAADKASRAVENVFENASASRREQFQATLLQAQLAAGRNAEANQKTQMEALQHLATFADGTDDVALDSLVLLARRTLIGGTDAVPSSDNNTDATAGAPQTPSDLNSAIRIPHSAFLQSEDLIGRLDTHPLAKAPQKLLATDLQLQSRHADSETLISEAIERWKNAEPAELAVFAMWLNGRGKFQKQLDAIPLERALATRELFLQHVDALGALNRWDEIKRLLESERFPLDPVMQRMYLARCNAQLGNEAASKNNWQRALEAAGGDVVKLMTLAAYAEKNGANEIANAAYESAVKQAPKLRPAQQGLLRIAQQAKDTKRMHAILAEMLALWPNDPAIQNDEAYMRLLLLPDVGGTGAVPSKTEPDAAAGVPSIDPATELIAIEKLAESLVGREPSSLPHRTLLALARLRQGRPVAALEVYAGIQAAPNSLTASALAVHAAVLSANGNVEGARKQIAQVPTDSLLPEEQAVIANLR